jgi:hypothetical protein
MRHNVLLCRVGQGLAAGWRGVCAVCTRHDGTALCPILRKIGRTLVGVVLGTGAPVVHPVKDSAIHPKSRPKAINRPARTVRPGPAARRQLGGGPSERHDPYIRSCGAVPGVPQVGVCDQRTSDQRPRRNDQRSAERAPISTRHTGLRARRALRAVLGWRRGLPGAVGRVRRQPGLQIVAGPVCRVEAFLKDHHNMVGVATIDVWPVAHCSANRRLMFVKKSA